MTRLRFSNSKVPAAKSSGNHLSYKKVLFIVLLCVLYVVGKHYKSTRIQGAVNNPATNLTLQSK
jgi:hypothetical protein